MLTCTFCLISKHSIQYHKKFQHTFWHVIDDDGTSYHQSVKLIKLSFSYNSVTANLEPLTLQQLPSSSSQTAPTASIKFKSNSLTLNNTDKCSLHIKTKTSRVSRSSFSFIAGHRKSSTSHNLQERRVLLSRTSSPNIFKLTDFHTNVLFLNFWLFPIPGWIACRWHCPWQSHKNDKAVRLFVSSGCSFDQPTF